MTSEPALMGSRDGLILLAATFGSRGEAGWAACAATLALGLSVATAWRRFT